MLDGIMFSIATRGEVRIEWIIFLVALYVLGRYFLKKFAK